MTNDTTADPATWPEDTECPIRAGDEVVSRDDPDTTGRVVRVYIENALTVCQVHIRGGTVSRYVYPWELATADTAVDPVDWDLRMQHFVTVQRDRVRFRMREQQRDILHRVIALTKKATAITYELSAGRIPGPTGYSPMGFAAADLDEKLRRMAAYREIVIEAGLFTPDDLEVQLAIEATVPIPAPLQSAAAEVSRTSPPPADGIAEADRLHGDIRDRRHEAEHEQLYATLCAKYGLDGGDPGHRDNDPDFDVAYLRQRDDLNGEIASAAGQLIDLIEAGGPLPTAWTRGRA
ncbi:hypothetical protein [Nocardia wallacei]|uniref:hypothetical protein n=1 Tax=Nocardia wallacei TaxID=480035 RepID=UPI0024543BD6|nr:hypothetical protein [Nocardia wallacei]